MSVELIAQLNHLIDIAILHLIDDSPAVDEILAVYLIKDLRIDWME